MYFVHELLKSFFYDYKQHNISDLLKPRLNKTITWAPVRIDCHSSVKYYAHEMFKRDHTSIGGGRSELQKLMINHVPGIPSV